MLQDCGAHSGLFVLVRDFFCGMTGRESPAGWLIRATFPTDDPWGDASTGLCVENGCVEDEWGMGAGKMHPQPYPARQANVDKDLLPSTGMDGNLVQSQ